MSGKLGLKPRPLTRHELEIMDVVWRAGEATVQEVCDALSRPLAYTTVMTTLSVLHSRKAVLERSKQGRAFVYRPLVSRQEVSHSLLHDLRSVLFGESLPSLVLKLVDDQSVSREDIVALREALEKVELEKQPLER